MTLFDLLGAPRLPLFSKLGRPGGQLEAGRAGRRLLSWGPGGCLLDEAGGKNEDQNRGLVLFVSKY